MRSARLKILIYGAGAVGQAIGCMLAADGQQVDLLLRERFRKAIRQGGLAVTGIFGDYQVGAEVIGLYTSIDEILGAIYDVVIITAKSYDTVTAVNELHKMVDQSFTIVTMQNGCGNLEMLGDHFGAERTLGARIITGFEIQRSGLVKITVSADAVRVGGYLDGTIPATADKLAQAINNAGLPCGATPHVRRDLLAKLLYNSALNPLGAILGVHYGELGDDPDTRNIMNKVLDEAFAVINAMGMQTHWDTADEYRTFFYGKQLPLTYEHRPSMLQDIENCKPTEVAAFTGYISAQGARHGVLTPTCDLLSGLVRFKEGHAS